MQKADPGQSEKIIQALKLASDGLHMLFERCEKKSHLLPVGGHPWIRVLQPMDEVRFIGITTSQGSGPLYLKLRAFLYTIHPTEIRRLMTEKFFSFEGVALMRGRAHLWSSWERDLAKEGRPVEGYEAIIKIDDWSDDSLNSKIRSISEAFCRFVIAVVNGGVAYDALPDIRPSQPPAPWLDDEAAVDAIIQNYELSDSERNALAKIRIGQSWFRDKLIDRWQGCSVTNCTLTDCLVASHIHAWSKCNTSTERWDVDNGLLLTPNLDKLFDKGLIGFDDHGNVILSKNLQPLQMQYFGLYSDTKLRPGVFNKYPNISSYLKLHREEHGLYK